MTERDNELMALLGSADPDERVRALKRISSDPAVGGPVVATLEGLLDDRAVAAIEIPPRHGEVRIVAAKALAATRSFGNDQTPVELRDIPIPMTSNQLSRLREKVGRLDRPLGAIALYEQLRAAGHIPLADFVFDPSDEAPERAYTVDDDESFDAAIEIELGNEYAPSSTWGQDRLVITSDGRFVYENRFRGSIRSTRRGSVDLDALGQALSDLAATGFPSPPAADILPGAILLVISRGDQRAIVDSGKLGPYAVLETSLLAWLDALSKGEGVCDALTLEM